MPKIEDIVASTIEGISVEAYTLFAHSEKGFEDTGKYDEKFENMQRARMETWVAYAESGPSYDPAGKYLCGTCNVRLEPDKCAPMKGKISLEHGSCRMYAHGLVQIATKPYDLQLDYASAQYGERPETKSFGCGRCEYAAEAKKPDSEGRPSWCRFFGVHIQPKACCAVEEGDDSTVPKQMEAGGPGSGRHKESVLDYALRHDLPGINKSETYWFDRKGIKHQGYGSETHTGLANRLWGINSRDAALAKGYVRAYREGKQAGFEVRKTDQKTIALLRNAIQSLPAEDIYVDIKTGKGYNSPLHGPRDVVLDKINRLYAAQEVSLAGDQKGTLWNGIEICGFTGPQEEGLRAMLSRIPPELLFNVKKISSAKELNAKHGRFNPSEKSIDFNPDNFNLRQRFGKGEGWIQHPELTVVHEVGHSIFDSLTPEQQQNWYDISGWMQGTKDGQAPAYQEKRPGWGDAVSEWTHKAGIKFTRHYAERNPNEDFADSFAFVLLGKGHQMEPAKKLFIDEYLNANVTRYPQVSIESPIKAEQYLYNNTMEAYGTSEGLQKAWDERGRGRHKDEGKVQRALASYNPQTKEKFRVALLNELLVIKAIQGQAPEKSFGMRWHPFDVSKGKNTLVEVKTIFPGSKQSKLTMHPASLRRKLSFAKKLGTKKVFTVAVDMRGAKPDIRVKQGVGSFALSSMTQVKNFNELKEYIR